MATQTYTHQQLVEIMDKIRSLASIDHCVDADEDIQKVFREYGVGVGANGAILAGWQKSWLTPKFLNAWKKHVTKYSGEVIEDDDILASFWDFANAELDDEIENPDLDDEIVLLYKQYTPLIELFEEFKKTREQYAKVGANDDEINESIMELMKQAIGFFDDDDEFEHVENTFLYWVNCLCTRYVANANVDASIVEIQAVAQKIIDCVAELKMSADDLEELYDDVVQ